MKKMLFLLLAATFALCNCTKQDLDEIRAKQAELDTRLSALEEWQRAINGQIASLQNLFSALEDNDYVTSVSELADGTGYVINFMKGGAITIKKGRQVLPEYRVMRLISVSKKTTASITGHLTVII